MTKKLSSIKDAIEKEIEDCIKRIACLSIDEGDHSGYWSNTGSHIVPSIVTLKLSWDNEEDRMLIVKNLSNRFNSYEEGCFSIDLSEILGKYIPWLISRVE